MYIGFIVAAHFVTSPSVAKNRVPNLHVDSNCLLSRAISVLVNFYCNPLYSFTVNRYVPTEAGWCTTPASCND